MISIGRGDALILVDVQNDFLPGGALPIRLADRVVPVLDRYLHVAERLGLPVFVTCDAHPPDHCSFRARGGPWPPHCLVGSHGAQIVDGLHLPPSTVLMKKGTHPDRDGCSAFDETGLDDRLRLASVVRVLVGGLATEYGGLRTVREALRRRLDVALLTDAVRAMNVQPSDGVRAESEMILSGAIPVQVAMVA